MWIFGGSTSQAKEEPGGEPQREQAYETQQGGWCCWRNYVSNGWVGGAGRMVWRAQIIKGPAGYGEDYGFYSE